MNDTKNMSHLVQARAIVASGPHASRLIETVGSCWEYLADSIGLSSLEEIGLDDPPGPGLWIWEGRLRSAWTHTWDAPDYDEWLEGTYRPLTAEEYRAYQTGQTPLEPIQRPLGAQPDFEVELPHEAVQRLRSARTALAQQLAELGEEQRAAKMVSVQFKRFCDYCPRAFAARLREKAEPVLYVNENETMAAVFFFDDAALDLAGLWDKAEVVLAEALDPALHKRGARTAVYIQKPAPESQILDL